MPKGSLSRFRGAVATAALTLGLGCSPLATFRPASGLAPENDVEVGAGGVALSPRPYVDEQWRGVGQLWASMEPASWLGVSAIAVFDPESAGAGAAARATIGRTHAFVAATELELGYAWIGLSVPMALRLWNETFLYAAPRVGTFGIHLTPGLPAGLSLHVIDGLFVRAEAQVSWEEFQAYNRRWHFGVATAYQF